MLSDQDVIHQLSTLAKDSDDQLKADPANQVFERDRDACMIAIERVEKTKGCLHCRYWGYDMLMRRVCINGESPCFGHNTRYDFFCADSMQAKA